MQKKTDSPTEMLRLPDSVDSMSSKINLRRSVLEEHDFILGLDDLQSIHPTANRMKPDSSPHPGFSSMIDHAPEDRIITDLRLGLGLGLGSTARFSKKIQVSATLVENPKPGSAALRSMERSAHLPCSMRINTRNVDENPR